MFDVVYTLSSPVELLFDVSTYLLEVPVRCCYEGFLSDTLVNGLHYVFGHTCIVALVSVLSDFVDVPELLKRLVLQPIELIFLLVACSWYHPPLAYVVYQFPVQVSVLCLKSFLDGNIITLYHYSDCALVFGFSGFPILLLYLL